MVKEADIYTVFATLLEYPHGDIKGVARECLTLLKGRPQYPKEAAEEVEKFLKEISEVSLDDLQGIYSYTFEIASGELTLDLTYHLYDGFKRSNYLVNLKTLYRSKDFPIESVAKGELPDNLPVVLKFLDFTDEETKKEIRENFLIKGLEKLNKNFEASERETPYRHLVKAILMIIDSDIKGNELLMKEAHQA